jgi:hypothetical protein
MAGQRSDQGRKAGQGAKGSAVWLNVCIAGGLLLLLAMGGALWWRQQTAAPAMLQEALLPSGWTQLESRDRLGTTFAATAELAAAPAAGTALVGRLWGQLCQLDVVIMTDKVRILERRGSEQELLLTEAVLPQPLPDAARLTLLKSPDSVALYLNALQVAAAPLPLQDWRRLAWGWAGDSAAAAAADPQLSFQRIAPLLFSDNFMHDEGALGEWKVLRGEWQVHALQTPVRSANPFSFLGRGERGEASAGYWFWRNYRFACAVHPLPGTSFGLGFCRVDDHNGYELRWRPDSGKAPAALVLSKRCDGQEQILAEKAMDFAAGFWTELAVSQLHGLLDVQVDGHRVMQVVDDRPFLGGPISLLSDGGEGTVFDDVDLRPVDRLELTGTHWPELVWRPRPNEDADDGSLRELISGDIGGIELLNSSVSCAFSGMGAGKSLLELRSRVSDGCALLAQLVCNADSAAGAASARILWLRPGGEEQLAQVALPALPASGELRFSCLGRNAWLVLDGQSVAWARVPLAAAGLSGVRLASSAGTKSAPPLTRIALAPALPLPQVTDRVETFTHEESMGSWNNPVLEWLRAKNQDDTDFWHRSDFWSALAVDMDLVKLRAITSQPRWGLSMGCEVDDGAAISTVATLSVDSKSNDVQFQPDRAATPLLLKMSRPPRSLGLERRDGRLLAYVDGEAAWNAPLPASLRRLAFVGRLGKGATRPWAEGVTLRAAGVKTDSFREAPSLWLPVAGSWEVTNRWECDPRWSFFSGVQPDGVACNWHKLRHGQALTVEYFVGPKMDSARGKKYEYAGDFNFVLAADGRDISSGYSFMFGGWDDRGSQILRKKELLLENTDVRVPRTGAIHRRWFSLKVRKDGARLSFWVDGALVGRVVDPEPLTGDRLGLWTWHNGMMVAQFRISSDQEDFLLLAPGSTPHAAPATPYE